MKAFGTIEADVRGGTRKAWVVNANPHVEARLRRLFQGAGAMSATKAFRLSNTPENCRELLLVLERYPMEMTAEDLAYLTETAAEHVAAIERFTAIADGHYHPRQFDLALPLRPYQALGSEAVLQRFHLLNADEIGLGKSAQALGMILDPSARPALIVTLTHLPLQWEREVHRFLPGMRTHILKGCTPYDLSLLPTRGRKKKGPPPEQVDLPGVDARPEYPDVIITSYSKIASWGHVLAQIGKSATFDEVQEFRHAGTSKYLGGQVISQAATYVLGLSGTPVYNYGGEFFPVMEIIAPGALGTYDEFARGWCSGEGRKLAIRDPKAFGAFLREQGLMLRRTRSELKLELPPVTKVVETIDADLDVLRKSTTNAAELARAILARSGNWADRGKMAEEFSNVMRQATGLAKAAYVAAFVRLLIESGEPVVLFGWHQSVYGVWREALKDLTPVFITGAESAAAKQRSVDAFTQGRTKLLIMSLRAGAGLDGLQKVCKTVVYGELDWSPQVIDQCTGRVARDGQTEPVFAYFPVTDHGADPIMMDVLGVKRGQSRGVLDPNAALVEALGETGGHIAALARAYLDQKHRKSDEQEEAA